MKNRQLLFITLFFALMAVTNIQAQDYFYQKLDKPQNKPTTEGNVRIYQDCRVDTIVARHIRYNMAHPEIDGYRIQIFFDAGNNSLSRAQRVSEEFMALYPTDTAYISFSEPYYKVRVGDFRTRIEAQGYQQQIMGDFPNAFVIKDKIRFPKLEE
jgi:hypothetical protein